jgi:hypothetical protein
MVEGRRIFSGQCREAFEREQRQRLVDIGAVVLAWIRLKLNAAVAICGAVMGARGSVRSAGGLRRFGIGRDYHVPAPIAPRSRRSHPPRLVPADATGRARWSRRDGFQAALFGLERLKK